jgi:dolichol-phosphate mannosyltransferase
MDQVRKVPPTMRSAADQPGGPPTSHPTELLRVGLTAGRGVAVVLPTYNERDNLERIAAAVLLTLPQGELVIVDDASPDGTGALADGLATRDPRIRVVHRPAKQGLGAAYRHAFRLILEHRDIAAVVQMDADFSHDPRDLPRLLAALADADLALGSRYIAGGGTTGWPLHRRLISRAGTLFARAVLFLPYCDLTGGFKAWRREMLEAVQLCDVSANGYGFQVEMTWWAHRSGARIVQVPITFRDRVAGASKMSGAIAREALWLILRLRWQAVVSAFRPSRPSLVAIPPVTEMRTQRENGYHCKTAASSRNRSVFRRMVP